MELKQIKELMAAMEKAGVKKLRIKDKDKYEIELELQSDQPMHPVLHTDYNYSNPENFSRLASHVTSPRRTTLEEGKERVKEAKVEEGKYVTAPMVGTLYTAPSPDDPPFIKVGDKVEENTVVCIIEAMKVMNEVKAGISGTVAEICIKNAHPVEFGTKLVRIV